MQLQVTENFRQQFGAAPELVVHAPGRVNLIGGHTDYNLGFVLPMAIERGIWLAAAPRRDGRVRVHALDYAETRQFSLSDWSQLDGWAGYVQGILWALHTAGQPLSGFDGVLGGNLPRGAGLSSSAALTLAVARAAAALSGLDWQPREMALLAQKAENDWIGVACGVMDQIAVACGEAGHATLLDCRSLDTRPVPLPEDTLVMVLDSGTRRELGNSAYNQRRQDCEQAAAALGLSSLREASLSEAEKLPEPLCRRARHVVSENARTLACAAALQNGDLSLAGRLLNESHHSLQTDFEVSSPALDAIAACAQQAPGCYGARMTGAGFGGCAVALIEAEAQDRFIQTVSDCYAQKTGLRAQIYPTRPAAGARLVG